MAHAIASTFSAQGRSQLAAGKRPDHRSMSVLASGDCRSHGYCTCHREIERLPG
jgi:hypothetical protein